MNTDEGKTKALLNDVMIVAKEIIFDFAVAGRTEAQIERAKRNAVGGKRKRCGKGKNCSATCIAMHMVCMVDIPWVGKDLALVKNMIMKGKKAQPVAQWAGGTPAPKKPQQQQWQPNLPSSAPKPAWQKEQNVKNMSLGIVPAEKEKQLKFNLKVAQNKGTPEQIAEAKKALKEFQNQQKILKQQAAAPASAKPSTAPAKEQGNNFFKGDYKYDFKQAMAAPGQNFGGGAQGAVRLLDNGQIVKEGRIGEFEAAVFHKLQGKGITPNLLGVEYSPNAKPKPVEGGLGGHVREKRGKLALELAPGKKFGGLYGDTQAEKIRKIDAYIDARARLHREGIAHNDMHGGNVFYDKGTGKATLIDMGLAQISPRAALAEALGTLSGRDWQANSIVGYNVASPKLDILRKNAKIVEKELLSNHQIEARNLPGIRSPQDRLDKAFKNMTDAEVQNLVNKLYEGV